MIIRMPLRFQTCRSTLFVKTLVFSQNFDQKHNDAIDVKNEEKEEENEMGQRNVSPDRFNNLGQCHLAISFELYLERTVDYLIVICIVHDPVHPKTAKR